MLQGPGLSPVAIPFHRGSQVMGLADPVTPCETGRAVPSGKQPAVQTSTTGTY